MFQKQENRFDALAALLSRKAYPSEIVHPCEAAKRCASVVAEALGAVPWVVRYNSIDVTVVGAHGDTVLVVDVEPIVREMRAVSAQTLHNVSVATILALTSRGLSPSWMVHPGPRNTAERVRVTS